MLLEWFKNSPEMNHILKETERIYEEYTGRAIFINYFSERGNIVVEFSIVDQD